MATPFLSYQFPPQADSVHTYLVSFGMGRVFRALRLLHGKAEAVETPLGPGKGAVRAKRQVFVEVARDPLHFQSIDRFRGAPPMEGADFRILAQMSYLDPAYRRLPIHGDAFLVRATLRGGRLVLQISGPDGLGRTSARDVDRLLREALEKSK